MGEVIFARPRWEYGSYSDLWKLVELSGYPLIYSDQMDLDSDNCYIFSTPATDWHHGWAGAHARIIYYSIEWYTDVDYSAIPGVEVWSADKAYAARIGAKYVPMGSHVGLNMNPTEKLEKCYDTITLWAASYRRYHGYDMLQQSHVTRAPDGWGTDRHENLLRARSLCLVHQNDNAAYVAPQRWALAAAYRLPVISEHVQDAGELAEHTIWTDLEGIGVVTSSWMRMENRGKLIAKGEALHQKLCHDMPFRASIERAL